MRELADALNPRAIPSTATAVASYVDPEHGNPFAELPALFPDALHVSISAHDHDAMVADLEHGAMSVAQVVAWIGRQRARGATPTVYASSGNWTQLVEACQAAGVAVPQWWKAWWITVKPTTLPPGLVAWQWTDLPPGNPYDLSIMADWIAGIDPPPPAPTPPTRKDDTMILLLVDQPGTDSDAVYLQYSNGVIGPHLNPADYAAYGKVLDSTGPISQALFALLPKA